MDGLHALCRMAWRRGLLASPGQRYYSSVGLTNGRGIEAKQVAGVHPCTP